MSDALAAISLRRSRSLTGIVHGELERMILAAEIKPGERVNEQALASRLGVSRGPVREAMRALERAGLLTAVVNQGAFVRTIGEEEAAEIYDVRAVIFGFACERLSRRLAATQQDALQGLIDEMAAAVERADSAEYYRLNLAFHDAVFDFAGHARAKETYASLIKETHLLRQSALTAPARMRGSNAEHARILAAIAAGDGELARRLGEQHGQGGKRRWLEARED